jgi:hypothetical protein
MAYNYSSLSATAKRLIDRFGRSVTLKKQSATPTDAAKPWRGSSQASDISTTALAVIVDFALEEAESDHVQRGDKRAYVAQDSAPEIDLSSYDRLVEADGQTWQIVRAETINPGDTKLMYDLQLRQ